MGKGTNKSGRQRRSQADVALNGLADSPMATDEYARIQGLAGLGDKDAQRALALVRAAKGGDPHSLPGMVRDYRPPGIVEGGATDDQAFGPAQAAVSPPPRGCNVEEPQRDEKGRLSDDI